MTATYEPHEQPSSQAGVSVLLIGDDDVVIRTSGLLWDTLPRFGEIRAMKLVPHTSVPFLDPSTFQLLFFHLSATDGSTELEALRDLRFASVELSSHKSVIEDTPVFMKLHSREKSCTLSAKAVYVLVVPEAGSDVPASAADFVLTQPLTVERVEEVFRKCSFLSEQSQNDSDSSASPISLGQQAPEPESTNPRAVLGAPVQESCGAEDWPAEGLPQGPSAELTSGDLQAFLHSKKEQKRRLQIKECCERLRELLPFTRNRMDTASTLEVTVKYMSYLRQRLPEDILEEAVKALEENGTGTWYKPTKAPKKRKACSVRDKPTDMPTPTSFADDFIAAHVLGRHIQPKLGATQPTATLPPPVVTSQSFDPRLDLNLDSAPGQMSAPFGQTFVMSQTHGDPSAADRCYSLPLFWKETCDPVPSIMVNRALVPQMIQNPRAAQAMVLDEPSLPPIQALMVGPDFFLPSGLDPALAPPAPTVTMNQTFAPLVILHDVHAHEAPASPPACPTTPRPIPTPASWPDPLLSEILYDSSPSLSGLSSFQAGGRVDSLLQSPTPESPFSQWSFGCESGPVYPCHSHFLESLSPPSPDQIQIQAPGSSVHSLADVPPPPLPTKLYGQHYLGGTDFQIN